MREENRLDWINNRKPELFNDMKVALNKTRDEIMDEAKKWAADYVKNEKVSLKTAIKRVSIDDMNRISKQAKKLVKDKNFGPEANKILKRYNFGMRMSRADALMFNIDERLLNLGQNLTGSMGKYLTNTTINEMMAQAGILGLNIQDSRTLGDLAQIITKESFHGTTFSEDIWKNQDILRNRLEQGLLKSLLLGQNPTKWMKSLEGNLQDAFQGADYALKRLAVTEGARVQSQAQKEMYKKGGYLQFEFMAETTACPICAALDGKIFDVDTLMPGINAAPIHPHCRCSTSAEYNDEQYREEYNKLLQDIKDGKAPEDLIPEKELEKILPKKSIPENIKKGTPEYDRYKQSDYYPEKIGKIGGKLVKKGKPMTFEEADNGKANPRYRSRTATADGYATNCQTTVVAHEARLRGYDISAVPNTPRSTASKLAKDTTSIWTTPDGKQPRKTFINSKNFDEFQIDMINRLKPGERYHISFGWKGQRMGHIITIESTMSDAGFKIYDPQSNHEISETAKLQNYFKRVNLRSVGLLRVDDLLFHEPMLNKILVPYEPLTEGRW